MVTVDKSGRISIKDDFKEYAKLTDEVLAVGTTNRVELWNPAEWDAWNLAAEEDDDIDFTSVGYSSLRGQK